MNAIRTLGILGNTLLMASLLACSHGLLKWVSNQPHQSFLDLMLGYWPQMTAALSVYGFLFFYYTFVLRLFNLAPLYSLYTGFAVLGVILIGVFFFEENLSQTQIVGCGLIVLGVLLVARI